jgi:hypothetical protein
MTDPCETCGRERGHDPYGSCDFIEHLIPASAVRPSDHIITDDYSGTVTHIETWHALHPGAVASLMSGFTDPKTIPSTGLLVLRFAVHTDDASVAYLARYGHELLNTTRTTERVR